jgi:hypothetical protein
MVCVQYYGLKRQDGPQPCNPYTVFILVEGRVDDQLHVRRYGQILGQLQPVEDFCSVLVIQSPFS